MEINIIKRPGSDSTKINEKDGVAWISIKALDKIPWLVNAFSTRLGGVSEGIYSQMNLTHTVGDDPDRVLENYRIMGKAIGVSPEDMVLAWQTHTVKVMKVDDTFRGMGIVKDRPYRDVDGIITDTPGLCLLTSYADCVPLYFVDTKNKAIGLSHSGWRGTVGNIAKNTIELMKDTFGSDPADIIACIGPSIEAGCYEIGEDVAENFREAYSKIECEDILIPEKERPGKFFLDLTMANVYNFLNSGIKDENIVRPDLCTACNSTWLHSHRASGGKRGGMCAFLMIKN